MAFEIVFKKRFIKKLIKVQTYLEQEWGDKVARTFLLKVDRRIKMLKQYPYLGVSSEKVPGLRGLLITKHNILFYKVERNRIIILNLYDTRSGAEK
jgi:plasmid stabilization system protein ParE